MKKITQILLMVLFSTMIGSLLKAQTTTNEAIVSGTRSFPLEIFLSCENYDFEYEEWLPILLDYETGPYSYLVWSTSGDGFFDDPFLMPAFYNLGVGDKTAGQITLSIQIVVNAQETYTFQTALYIPRQIIDIQNTGFAGISSFLDLGTTPVPDILEPIEGCFEIISNHNGQNYSPELGNQIGNWMPMGYKIKMLCPACLALYGEPLQNRKITISKPLMFLPVLCEYPVDIEQLFAGYLNNIVMIYDWESGNMYMPDAGIQSSLTILQPGRAYLLQTMGPVFDIEFPGGSNTCQELLLKQGWSGISLYLTPDNPLIEDIFDGSDDNVIIMYSDDGIWLPQAGINTLGNWNNNTSYVIKVENDKNLSICGSPLTNKTVFLQSGWNYLPVLSTSLVNCMQLFSSVMDDVVIVKEIAGSKVFWPEKNINTLNNLEPDKGYLIKTAGNVTVTFP